MDYIADSFYHFTKKLDFLFSIIQNGFYPRYCIEEYDYLLKNHKKNGLPTTIAIPVVCFCDIPLDFIDEHISDYGHFAIAMKKSWGIERLNPILYLTDKSMPQKKFELLQGDLFGKIKKKLEKEANFEYSEEIKEIFYHFHDFIAYMKKYKGSSTKRENNEKIFYREREWRWIPEQSTQAKKDGIILRLDPSEYCNIDKYNKILEKYYVLEFENSDIDYIIVDNKENKIELEKRIMTLDRQKKELIAKIRTIDDLKKEI
jgi:hypothetical protein